MSQRKKPITSREVNAFIARLAGVHSFGWHQLRWLSGTACWLLLAAQARGQELIDYSLYNQTITIEKFRAGHHDASGTNNYYFRVTMTGVLNTLEERKKALKDRKSIPLPLGEFADITLPSLAFLPLESDSKGPPPVSFSIDGTQIRELAANSMSTFKVREELVAIYINIELFERNKRFKFFGEDELVGSSLYFPLPLTRYDVAGRTNLALEIRDERGAWVQLHVTYQDAINKGQRVAYPAGES